MSESEEDIWGYKSIRKPKASDGSSNKTGAQDQALKTRVEAKRGGPRKRNATRKTKNIQGVTSPMGAAPQEETVQGQSSPEDALSTPKKKKIKTMNPSPVTPQNRHSGHCPSCQMPFSILLVQSPRWHVTECLDAPSTAQTECPDGVSCLSTLPSHYKRFSHFLLAQSRDMDQTSLFPASTTNFTLPKATPPSISNGFTYTKNKTPTTKKNTQLKSKSPSPTSSQESVSRTPLDIWLSSPSKSSQETPSRVTATESYPLPEQDASICNSTISYSPLVSDQELFSEDEGDSPTQCNNSNGQAVDPPLDYRASTCESPVAAEMMITDLSPECYSPVVDISDRLSLQPNPKGAANIKIEDHAAPRVSTHLHSQLRLKAEQLKSQIQEGASQSSPSMAPVPPGKAMKQMDIGVFFGLKPKVVTPAAEVKAPLKIQSPNAVTSQSEKPPRKRKATGSLGDAGGLAENLNGASEPKAAWTQRRGGKGFGQNSTEEGGRGKKQCPFYKKIPGTGFAVDAFQYGQIDGCSAYFLTHFHSDHYGGLTKKFRFPIYCSKITGNLVQSKLRVEKEFINCLPMYTECMVNGINVVLLDANHCPGAVLLLFILPNGTSILHTGDFRADTSMERYPALLGRKIHTLYLDTTYCSPEYTFPPQQEAVQFAVNAAFEMVTLYPRTLVVCGTYSVGKEKVFLAIADVLGCKVCMSQDKYKTMQCLESDEIRALVTTDWDSTALHVLPMMQVNFKGLYAHLNKFSGKYDRVLAFKPTGWTYSEGCGSVADIRPEVRGKVTMYGV
ncbi:hypothetical protein GDO81_019792 [Engystomops pustulosus]|uniref:DNA cross-link repair 1A protein n=1 Tax=Engystomops pustulosus TaxID=76066 RepID=A0AAV6ZKE6_ENGPU|nr:hypothetical protein GDO81_019792 [Engystomops pustulosus]